MSRSTIIWVVIIVIIVLGGGWYFLMGKSSSTTATDQQNGSDTSDTSLIQDTAVIDAEMSGLSSDSASLNQSLSDQAGTQSY